MHMTDLSVKLGTETLRNPIILAAGTCGVMGEIKDAIDLGQIGAITTKSITHEPRIGNEPHRVADLPAGMLNAIGLANEGIDSFMEHQAPKAALLNTTVIGSVAGESIEEYVNVATSMCSCEHIKLIELNVSCPNTDDGLEFGASPSLLQELVSAVVGACNKPIIVKLSAAPGDISEHATATVNAGAAALTLINTIPALSIDVHTRKTKITRGVGGLSGEGIHPIALRFVHQMYQHICKERGIPIIGTGGVTHWEDAAEFILAGATCVGIGTASYINPTISTQISAQLASWVHKQNKPLSSLVGSFGLTQPS